MSQASLERLYDVIDILETIITYTRVPHQIYKLQIQPQAVSCSALSLVKENCFNFGLYPINITTVVSSDIDPDTSCIKNKIRFFTLIFFNFEPDINITTTQKIIISYDLNPDLFKLEHSIHSDEVNRDGFSELSKSTTNTYKSKLSRF